MPRSTITIQTQNLKNLIQQSGFKHYHLAQRLGVSDKTIQRWVNGKTTQITTRSALALSELLGCPLSAFTQPAQTPIGSLFSEDLLALLAPTHNWSLILHLLHSLPDQPQQPLHQGRRYNWLSTANWRLQRYSDATQLALKALETGQRHNLKAVEAIAYYNLGTIDSLTGDITQALDHLKMAHQLKGTLASIKDIGAICNNLGMIYADLGDWDQARLYIHEALQVFEKGSFPLNSAISRLALGYVACESGNFDEAREHLLWVQEWSMTTGDAATLLTSQIYGHYLEVISGVVQSLDIPLIAQWAASPKHDPYTYWMVYACCSHTHQEALAQHHLAEGLKALAPYPILLRRLAGLADLDATTLSHATANSPMSTMP